MLQHKWAKSSGAEGLANNDTHPFDGWKKENRGPQNNTCSCPVFPGGSERKEGRKKGNKEGKKEGRKGGGSVIIGLYEIV